MNYVLSPEEIIEKALLEVGFLVIRGKRNLSQALAAGYQLAFEGELPGDTFIVRRPGYENVPLFKVRRPWGYPLF